VIGPLCRCSLFVPASPGSLGPVARAREVSTGKFGDLRIAVGDVCYRDFGQLALHTPAGRSAAAFSFASSSSSFACSSRLCLRERAWLSSPPSLAADEPNTTEEKKTDHAELCS